MAANLLSVLGCIIYSLGKKCGHKFFFYGVNEDLRDVMRRNGFFKNSGRAFEQDTKHTTIEYRYFRTDTDSIKEFELYTVMNIMERDDLPNMSQAVKHRIVDNILEIFNNVIDHAETDRAYVCGQYFVNKKKLVVTIADIGKAIKENVTTYLQEEPISALEWAIKEGNSTKAGTPGGLGISMLLEFLKLNEGVFTLISDNECLEVNFIGRRMNRVNINVRQKIDSPSALTREQGMVIYDAIVSYLKNGDQIELDFGDIESLITPFLNVAIGKLYEDYSSEEIAKHLDIVNIPEGKIPSFNLVIKNAKRYYADNNSFDETVKGVLEV